MQSTLIPGLASGLVAAFLAFAPMVQAQPAVASAAAQGNAASAPRGPGMGPGGGPGMGPGATSGMQGNKGTVARGRAGPEVTPGWSMMTPEERQAHRTQMRGAGSAQECRKLMDEHHALMEKRAQERGLRMRGPRGNACAAFADKPQPQKP